MISISRRRSRCRYSVQSALSLSTSVPFQKSCGDPAPGSSRTPVRIVTHRREKFCRAPCLPALPERYLGGGPVILQGEDRHVVGRRKPAGVGEDLLHQGVAGFLQRSALGAHQRLAESRVAESLAGRIGKFNETIGVQEDA